MKMYKTNTWHTVIKEYEVTKTTDKQLFYVSENGNTMREAKNSQYAHWFDTRKEAIKHLLQVQKGSLRYAENLVEIAKGKIAELEMMLEKETIKT